MGIAVSRPHCADCIADGEEGTNQRDTDNYSIGDDCDPTPTTPTPRVSLSPAVTVTVAAGKMHSISNSWRAHDHGYVRPKRRREWRSLAIGTSSGGSA